MKPVKGQLMWREVISKMLAAADFDLNQPARVEIMIRESEGDTAIAKTIVPITYVLSLEGIPCAEGSNCRTEAV